MIHSYSLSDVMSHEKDVVRLMWVGETGVIRLPSSRVATPCGLTRVATPSEYRNKQVH